MTDTPPNVIARGVFFDAEGREQKLHVGEMSDPEPVDPFDPPQPRTLDEHERALLAELNGIPSATLQSWIDRSYFTVMGLAKRELARRRARYVRARPPASGAPGHTLCDYEACDQTPTVTLPRGAVMCEHHAAVALLGGMSADDARATFRFARPVPETSDERKHIGAPLSDAPPGAREWLAAILERFTADEQRRRALPGNHNGCPTCGLSGYEGIRLNPRS
jgi:hypothetical protein